MDLANTKHHRKSDQSIDGDRLNIHNIEYMVANVYPARAKREFHIFDFNFM